MRKGKGPKPNDKGSKPTIDKPNLPETRAILPANADLSLPKRSPENSQSEGKHNLDTQASLVPFLTAFRVARDAVVSAIDALNITNPDSGVVPSMWCKVEKREKHIAYFAKLQTFIEAGNKLNEILREYQSSLENILLPQTQSSLTESISVVKKVLLQLKSVGSIHEELEPDFLSVEKFINDFFATKGKLKDEKTHKIAYLAQEINRVLPVSFPPVHAAVTKMYELIQIKSSLDDDFAKLLHNTENVLIECRLIMPILPEFTQRNISMNRDILTMQINMLKHFTKLCGEKTPLWPYLNKETNRPQSAEVNVAVSILLIQKERDVGMYTDQFAQELTPLSQAISTAGQVYSNLRSGEDNLDGQLSSLVKLTGNDTFKNNPLVRCLVLQVITSCYSRKLDKNQGSGDLSGEQIGMLQTDLLNQTKYLTDFMSSLPDLVEMRTQPLYKFINNFIFIKNVFQEVIADTELAYLSDRIIYKYATVPADKDIIIASQMGFLFMQTVLLTHISYYLGEDYLRIYYFKESNGSLVRYNAIAKNIEAESRGDLLNIVKGLLIKNVLIYNEERTLKLETIPLERAAQQWEPKDEKEYFAIDISEEELRSWAKQAAKEKRVEEEKKKPPVSKKQKDLKKLAKKSAERAAEKRKQKAEEEKPGDAPSTQLVVLKKATDPMSEKLTALLLTLDPHNYSPAKIKTAINDLHPLLASSNHNNPELEFNTRSAIGDSYSMIASHTLKQRDGVPETIMVNMKLAFQYYRMALLPLDMLGKFADKKEAYYHYCTWLHHTVSNQWQLLKDCVQKFTKEYAELLISKRIYIEKHPKWYDNHKNPDWKPSPKTLRRRQLQAALGEINKNLPVAIESSPDQVVFHGKVPLVQVELQDDGAADVARPLAQIEFHPEMAANVAEPSAQRALQPKVRNVEVFEEPFTESKVPPKPKQSTQASLPLPPVNDQKPNGVISNLQSLEDKFKTLEDSLRKKIETMEANMEKEVQRRVETCMGFVFQNYLEFIGKGSGNQQPIYREAEVVSDDESGSEAVSQSQSAPEEDEIDYEYDFPPLPAASSSSSSGTSSSPQYAASSSAPLITSAPPQPVVSFVVASPVCSGFSRMVNFNPSERPFNLPFPPGMVSLPYVTCPMGTPVPFVPQVNRGWETVPPPMQQQPVVLDHSADVAEAFKLTPTDPKLLKHLRGEKDKTKRWPMRPIGSTASTSPQCSTALSASQSSCGTQPPKVSGELPTVVVQSARKNGSPEQTAQR